MKQNLYLAGSPYYVEDVLGIDMCRRAQSGQLTHLLLNQPPICDCRCRRCFMPASRRGKTADTLSLEESQRVIREAQLAGMFCLEISGEGEPLLSKHLPGVIQCAFDCGFTTTLITNGHYLTDDFVRFIFERNVTLVVSVFSLNKDLYELDNNLPGSFDATLDKIRKAASLYRTARNRVDGKTVYRMAIHTTAQGDNLSELKSIRKFCSDCGIFFSLAPLAPVGGGANCLDLMLNREDSASAQAVGHGSIILSRTSKTEIGREVCGTCLYGLNIGYDGNVLFDAHAGYEVGSLLGNVRDHSIEELARRQRKFAPLLFQNIDGFCPVRDPRWPAFLREFVDGPPNFHAEGTSSAPESQHVKLQIQPNILSS